MKTFKQLHEIANTSHQDLAVDKNINPVSFGNPEVVKKLNAWVGTIAGSYVLPEDAIHKLRSSLAKIGLSFGECNLEGDNRSLEKPLTLYGGRFGKGLETPYDQFEEDDGISYQKEGGLKLVIGYEMNEDGSTGLTASIK